MIVLETLGRRWYAFAFIVGLFWAAVPERGWKGALRFLVIASLVSLGAEYSSTHTGFPYGRYDYIRGTRGKELFVSNVPLFVPLSFGCVVWAGRSLAKAWGARRRHTLILFGAIAATAIDLIIDPMTLRGNEWFLGRLYNYRSSGPWFHVPWSNYGGWLLVSAVIIGFDIVYSPDDDERPSARGLILAAGMCLFFIAIAIATRNWAIGAASVAVTVMLCAPVARARRRVTELPGTG